MILAERHIIKKNNPQFEELDRIGFLAKNLYNSAIFRIRKEFFDSVGLQNRVYLTGYDINKLFVREKQPDYFALPSKVSNQIVMLAGRSFKSFFALLKAKRAKPGLTQQVNFPGYLKKDGRYVAVYTNQAISKIALKDGFVALSGTSIRIETKQTEVQQVRVVPKNDYIVVEVLYKAEEPALKASNSRYASIDIGVNNLATISSNVSKPLILNGKPLKSINQYSNKRIAQLQSRLTGGRKTSRRIESIRRVRLNKIQDYLHKASREVANYVVSNDINCLVIGKNKTWKQNVNLGKKNNQNFVDIPFARFIEMINYKLKLLGVDCVINEESYTSKCSFLDFEEIGKHEVYLGKRIKRGLFKAGSGKLINADLNGSLNILRKVVGNDAFANYPIEVISSPVVLTIKFN